MAIKINTSFSVGAPVSIDERLVMTWDRMLNVDDNVMPEVYLTVCSDDGRLYIYNKHNAVHETTGKFRVMEAAASGDDATAATASIMFASHLEFPNVGDEKTLYVAEDEDLTYRWCPNTQTYHALNKPAIECINCTL